MDSLKKICSDFFEKIVQISLKKICSDFFEKNTVQRNLNNFFQRNLNNSLTDSLTSSPIANQAYLPAAGIISNLVPASAAS